jgi:ABC-type lipoprotein export system ATPase subunit
VLELLSELNADGQTLIVVTHDEGVGRAANRMIRMRDGGVVSDELTRVAP